MTRGVLARTGAAVAIAVLCGRALSSYVVLSDKWPDGTVTIVLNQPGRRNAMSVRSAVA